MAPCSGNVRALVDEQEIAFGVVDDEDVRQVVIVDVGNRHAHSFAARLGKPACSVTSSNLPFRDCDTADWER
jgi:hypothetical protein